MSDFCKACIYFSSSNLAKANRLAEAEGLNRSRLVNKAIAFYEAHRDTVELANRVKK